MNSIRLMMILIVLASFSFAETGAWTELFDGKTLDGWSVHSGTATYKVEDGAIVGTTVSGSPNTFLCTDLEYQDFILEFEVMVDPELNSGVQFRSKIAPREMAFIFRGNEGEPQTRKIPQDRVYGYQVEIATEKNGTSGGVYDEARRAFFLDNVSSAKDASQAFKDDQWNAYRIECRGNRIQTWVNAVPCADFQDDLTFKGIIGLQVHGIGNNPNTYQVRWRNIRILELD